MRLSQPIYDYQFLVALNAETLHRFFNFYYFAIYTHRFSNFGFKPHSNPPAGEGIYRVCGRSITKQFFPATNTSPSN